MPLAQSLSFADETVKVTRAQRHSIAWLALGLYKLSWGVSSGSVNGGGHLISLVVPWLWVDEAVCPTHPQVSKVHHTQQCHIVSTASGSQQPSSADTLAGSGAQGTCGKGPGWEGGPRGLWTVNGRGAGGH